MVDFKRNTFALVVSDVHIGNEFSRIGEFTTFLKDILLKKNSKELPFLRALIIFFKLL